MLDEPIADMRSTEGDASIPIARAAAVLLVAAFGQRCWELWKILSGSTDIMFGVWRLMVTLLALTALPYLWRGSRSAVISALLMIVASCVTLEIPLPINTDGDNITLNLVVLTIAAVLNRAKPLTADSVPPSAAPL